MSSQSNNLLATNDIKSLNCRKILLSLSVISFLQTCVDASIATASDKISNGSVKIVKATDVCDAKQTDCTISTTINNSTTIENIRKNITITSDGVIKVESSNIGLPNPAIVVRNVTIENIKNEGLISSKSAGIRIQSSSIDNVTNTGTIEGDRGIYFAGGTIGSIYNSGTIIANSNELDFSGQRLGAIVVQSKAHISDINNGGFISFNSGSGIVISQGSPIEKEEFEIETIVNSGTIKWDGTKENLSSDKIGNGIYTENMYTTTIGKIDNSGLIDVYNGMFFASDTIIETINNTGTILAKQDGIVLGDERKVEQVSKTDSNEYNINIKTINNTGTILADRYGVFIENSESKNHIETIQVSGIIIGNKAGIYNQSGSIENIILNSNAIISGNTGIINEGTLGKSNDDIKSDNNAISLNEATISASIEQKGKIIHDSNGNAIDNKGTILGNIVLSNKSKIIGVVNNEKLIQGSIKLNDSFINAIDNKGTIENSIDLTKSHIDSISNTGMIKEGLKLNNSSINAIDNKGTIENSIDLTKSHIDSISNTGMIKEGLKLDNSSVDYIENFKTLSIELEQSSSVGKIVNFNDTKIEIHNNSKVGILENKQGSITIDKDETSSIDNIINSGTIENYFQNKDKMENIINDEDATVTGIHNHGVIQGGIFNNGNIDKSLVNQGNVDTISNNGSITSIVNCHSNKCNKNMDDVAYIDNIQNNELTTFDLKNISSINHIYNQERANISIIYNDSNIDNIYNIGTIGDEKTSLFDDKVYGIVNNGNINQLKNDGVIFNGIYNNGTVKIDNTGTIYGGIVNSGTIFLDNAQDKYGEKASIGKSSQGYHLENNNNGIIKINGWYFNAPEYESEKDRLENSIAIGGDNLEDIHLNKIYINTANVVQGAIYDGNTFFTDSNGDIKGHEINDGKGVNADSIEDPTGLFDFVNLGGGKYSTQLDLNELSGETLAKSIIYSARLRNINISNILRETNFKNFQTEFDQVSSMDLSTETEEYGNDADLLAELEDIFIFNKNPKATNYSFLIPYYSNFSITTGGNSKRLKGNTFGLVGGTQKELPNDNGVIGFYLGHEKSSKEQAYQRLKFDDKSYYGGLTYYGVLARKGIDQYYISIDTILDYTDTILDKTYKNNSAHVGSDIKTYGYGIDIKTGANYYNTLDIARISPEIGLSYYGISNESFFLKHFNNAKETYNGEHFNFVDLSAVLKVHKPWSDKLKTSIVAGSIINLYNDAKGSMKLGKNKITADIETSKYYGFGQLGLSYAIAKNAELSLNYSGVFTFSNTASHSMFFKLGLWW
ncbi:autotransporter outer membrane beta-barrel domain-containing protein [Campylobacter lari]|nr:autotransporter outer membrane beta-barrel domain-containing protein [Campylobacter lari]